MSVVFQSVKRLQNAGRDFLARFFPLYPCNNVLKESAEIFSLKVPKETDFPITSIFSVLYHPLDLWNTTLTTPVANFLVEDPKQLQWGQKILRQFLLLEIFLDKLNAVLTALHSASIHKDCNRFYFIFLQTLVSYL